MVLPSCGTPRRDVSPRWPDGDAAQLPQCRTAPARRPGVPGGGGLCGSCPTNHVDGQIFTPPYLLNADGTPPRPTITTAPTSAAAGSTISVTTGRGVAGFSLVRMGSATHTVDTDQRRIPLTINGTTGNTSTVALPADRGVLVPGNYMLFALDAASGVPSAASTITIS